MQWNFKKKKSFHLKSSFVKGTGEMILKAAHELYVLFHPNVTHTVIRVTLPGTSCRFVLAARLWWWGGWCVLCDLVILWWWGGICVFCVTRLGCWSDLCVCVFSLVVTVVCVFHFQLIRLGCWGELCVQLGCLMLIRWCVCVFQVTRSWWWGDLCVSGNQIMMVGWFVCFR